MNQTLCLGGISPSQLGRERASPAGAVEHRQCASSGEVRGCRRAVGGGQPGKGRGSLDPWIVRPVPRLRQPPRGDCLRREDPFRLAWCLGWELAQGRNPPHPKSGGWDTALSFSWEGPA